MCSRMGDPAPCLVPEHGRHAGMYHAQVVDTARAQHLALKADDPGFLTCIERQVVVEYVVDVYTGIFGNKPAQHTAGVVAIQSHYGQHVALFRQGVALVDLAVEMYCQVRYYQQGVVETQQPHTGAQGVVAAQGHTTGD